MNLLKDDKVISYNLLKKSEVSLRVSYRPAWGLDQTALGLKPAFRSSYLSCLPLLFCKLRTITETILTFKN